MKSYLTDKNKYLYQTLLFFSVCFCTINGFSKEKLVKVGLSELKQFAIKNNFKLKSLEYKVKSVHSKQKKSKSKFFPKFGLSVGVNSENEENQNQTNGIGYLYGTYNLFNGMKDSLKYRLNTLEVDYIKKEFNNEKFVLGKNVEIAYYQYIFFKNLYNLKREELLLNRTHTKLVKKKRKAGQVSNTDVMEFVLKDSLLKSDLVSIDQSLLESRIELQKILGDEVGSNIRPEEVLPHQHIIEDLNNLDQRLKESGPEILKMENLLTQSKIQSNLYKSGWLPKIDVEAKAGYLGEIDQSTNGNQSAVANIAILLKWDFFSGFETSYAKEENVWRLKSINHEVKQKIFDVIGKLDVQVRRLKSIADCRECLAQVQLELVLR